MKEKIKRLACGVVALSVLCLMAISCSSPTGSDSRALGPIAPSYSSEPGVYIGGAYTAGARNPCYWWDGEIVELSAHGLSSGGSVGACFNNNGTIHFAGMQNDFLSLWTNRYREDLGSEYASTPVVTSMFVRGSDSYVVGKLNFSAVLWVNGDMTTFIHGTSSHSGVLEGIYVDEELNTHICGTENNNTPLYWKNNADQILPTTAGSGTADDITMSGGHVYIVGSAFDGVSRVIACYWIDGVRHDLATASTDSSKATAIYIDGSDIYIGGYYYAVGTTSNHACYWKNGVLVDLPGLYAHVADIVVSAGKVHACGNARSDILVSTNVGCYWVDGVMHELPSLCDDGTYATCIVVK